MFENMGMGTQIGLGVVILALAYGLVQVLATKPLPGLLQRRGTVRPCTCHLSHFPREMCLSRMFVS